MRISRFQFTGIVLLLAVHFVLALGGSWDSSFTADEPEHLNYGLEIIDKMRVDRSDAQRMPVTSLNALPLTVAGHEKVDRDSVAPVAPGGRRATGRAVREGS